MSVDGGWAKGATENVHSFVTFSMWIDSLMMVVLVVVMVINHMENLPVHGDKTTPMKPRHLA